MGSRGPKPLPDNVHALNGNPSKKNLGGMTGSDVPIEIPDAPDHLDKIALEEWKRISFELYRLGLIAKVDRANLAVYCMAYSRWVHAETKIKEKENSKDDADGGLVQKTINGYLQMGVWLQISNRAVEQMRSAASEFGMSPSARVRVNPNPQLDLFTDDGEDGDKKESGKKASKKKSKNTNAPASYFKS